MKRSAASTVPLVLLLLLAVVKASAAATGGKADAAEAEHAANYLVYVDPHPTGVDCQESSLIIACFVDGEQPQVNRVLPSATLSLMSSKFDGVS
ncbi:unnamed protein product [Miscanthus lutarioriparius]|uniref:Uncharacterized protein n=1 Tax=Miscanthus lutarioriparius TaxID=422564 RepID=A0A811MIA7_9POAL|nr:unnamed protein product [Miscanthus lutarioriparius]